MFQRRLVLSFALVAVFAVAYGVSGWWISQEAEFRVMRARLASDLHFAMHDLRESQIALTNWADGRISRPAPVNVTEADRILLAGAAISARIADIRALSLEADRLDRERGKILTEHAERSALLDRMMPEVVALRRATMALAFGDPVDPVRLGLMPNAPLATLMEQAVAEELEVLNRQRTATDQTLARVEALSVGSTVGFLSVCLSMVLYLLQALRRPVAQLVTGLREIEAGNLSYRVTGLPPGDEFGRLAKALNRLTEDLSRARDDEAVLRASLKDQINEGTRELSETIAALEASERMRRQLLADIGHELRTPTTVIRGEAEIALRGQRRNAADYRGALERIGGAARQLGKVLDDLLTLSRDDAEALPMQFGRTDVGEALTEALSQAATLGDLRGVTVMAPVPLAGGEVLGDGLRLRQIIGILLDNAIRYSHPRDKVQVRAMAADGRWTLEIADTGIGVPADEAARIFERGFRGAVARRHRADGSGLGLAIARALTERHRGTLVLEANPGGGTLARLTLPLLRGSLSDNASKERAA